MQHAPVCDSTCSLPRSRAIFSLVSYVLIPVYSSKLNTAVTSKEPTCLLPPGRVLRSLEWVCTLGTELLESKNCISDLLIQVPGTDWQQWPLTPWMHTVWRLNRGGNRYEEVSHALSLAIGAIGPISQPLVTPFHEGCTLFSREPLGTCPMTTFLSWFSFHGAHAPNHQWKRVFESSDCRGYMERVRKGEWVWRNIDTAFW